MKDAPIPATLDFWSLGHSATDIMRKLGFPNRRHVEKIVARARAAGDPRAVYHVAGGRILGTGIPAKRRYPKGKTYRKVLLVPRLGKPLCTRGHMRTPYNVDEGGHCKQCNRAMSRR